MTTITQDNLYLLLPTKIGWLAPWLSEDEGISLTDAVNRIYRSELYSHPLNTYLISDIQQINLLFIL